MTDRRTDSLLQDLHRGTLITAAALAVAGSVLGVIGFALSAVAVVVAGRCWYLRADLPPNQLARLKWEQAKAAAEAGAEAWRVAKDETYAPRSLYAR